MHAEALAWVAYYARECGDPARVLDLGGRDVNGSPKPFFSPAEYVTLDVLPGADITADAATWEPDRLYDVVVSTETFEHTSSWREIVGTAFKACAPGGFFIATCAGPGRAPHSGVDGRVPRDWEHYGNVSADDLRDALIETGWGVIACESKGNDTRAFARRPR
jgi:hypothetical protein